MSNKCKKLITKLKTTACRLCFSAKSSRFLYVGKENIYESVAGLIHRGIKYEEFLTRLKEFKPCCKDCFKKYKDKNKRVKQYTSKSRNDLLNWYKQKKRSFFCQDCGEDRYYLLDFHHLRDKKMTIARMISNGYSKDLILEEMGKCLTLCGNCHVKKHFGNKKMPTNNRNKLWRDIKNSSSCLRCGEKNPYCLQFHHRNKKKKLFAISEATKLKKSPTEIYKEIQKCDLICNNCHKALHHAEFASQIPV